VNLCTVKWAQHNKTQSRELMVFFTLLTVTQLPWLERTTMKALCKIQLTSSVRLVRTKLPTQSTLHETCSYGNESHLCMHVMWPKNKIDQKWNDDWGCQHLDRCV